MRLDRRVAAAKFARERERVVARRGDLDRIGCFLTGAAEYPYLDFLFVPRNPVRISIPVQQAAGLVVGPAAHVQAVIQNLAARAFKIRVGLDDYDLRAPSVRFVDFWTDKDIPYATMFRGLNIDKHQGAQVVTLDKHPKTGLPFLCIRGVREYHEHPQHTGDDWLLIREDWGVFPLLLAVHRTCVDNVYPNMILGQNQILTNWQAMEGKS